ncbi:glycosyltransferase [Patescibacteria group bacterium]|nr:glycosyltransferase [Patescibacteria group bacterium]
MSEASRSENISIIIPAYNEEKYIAESIKYAKKQQGNFDIEIIVVNNASTDKTKQIAESFNVKVIDEIKKGVGQARKIGTEASKGKYILHIDADTHLPEDYLQQAFQRFEKDNKLVCLGGQMLYYDAPWWKDVLRFIFHHILGWGSRILSLGRVGPMGNNMIFRKSDYNKTKGFDSAVRYGEDADLSWKLSKLGKIKLDMSLKCFVSSRRYKINGRLWLYFLNYLSICLRGKPYKNVLPEIK